MNIKKELLTRHSKKQAQKIARFIGDDRKKFSELMGYFTGNDYRLTQWAACVMNEVLAVHPKMIKPWLPKTIPLLRQPVHDAVKRNLLRIFQFIDIPGKFEGEVVASCFSLLHSPTEPLAAKAFSMTVLFNITKKHPELAPELRSTVKALMEKDPSPAIQARGRRTLKGLEKIGAV